MGKRTSRRPRSQRTSRSVRANPSWPWTKRHGQQLWWSMVQAERGGDRSYTRDEWVEHLCISAIKDLNHAREALAWRPLPGSLGEQLPASDAHRRALSFLMSAHRSLGQAGILSRMPDADGKTFVGRFSEYAHVFEGEYRLVVREWDTLPE